MPARVLLFSAAFIALLSGAAQAQNSQATLTIVIHDPDGRPVAGAPIQLQASSGGELRNGASGKDGSYTFSALPAGTFDLVIPRIGFTFQKFERKAITILRSEAQRLEIGLQWAGNLGTVGDDDSAILRAARAVPMGPAPRTPDGKPDLSGVWNGQNDTNPQEPAVLPWAEQIRKNRSERDDPSTLCLPSDILLNSPNVFEVIQTPKQVLIVGEYNVGAHRQIFLDGRPHPTEINPTWMGHSIGRWEGDMLVVDTLGFHDRSWLGAYPHTEKLHVVTRYSRPDLGHLDIQITVEDPDTLARPWTLHHVWELVPGEEIQEFVCENNKDPQHIK